MSDQPFATGSCRCGAVTLTINGKPMMMAQCHCSDCQKTTGTGHASNTMFSAEDVEIHGEATGHTVTTDSGNQNTRYFCPTCGSRMYGLNSGRPGMITIPVGCFDDHSWFSPQAVVYTSRRNDWDITSDQIPNFEAMPPPKP